ncbi:MAG: replication-associated recombination protein A [Microbacter sp.]
MTIPLAERMRPHSLDDYVGQKHLVGDDGVIRQMIASGHLTSFILWGPPGVGKTTLARIIANVTNRTFYALSAINSGVKEVRDIIESAGKSRLFDPHGTILFIDEIHRFSKSQQDALLGAVEDGTFTLIGATTENPSFEVITPLLSRCQVFILNPLNNDELDLLLQRALTGDEVLKQRQIDVIEKDALFRYAGGDARKLLNIIEMVVNYSESDPIVITNELVTKTLVQHPVAYDKLGEMHYDIISAFIKSVRGSDPDAAVYWLARMVAGGEDPQFIARRLVILAAEDIGLANPNALLLANACFEAISKIGWPESRIILSETAIYLASSPKSNSAYLAIDKALAIVEQTGDLPVPLHLRNAPTTLMKQLHYGTDYIYPHDRPDHFVKQHYLPEQLKEKKFWDAANNSAEQKQTAFLNQLWGNRF